MRVLHLAPLWFPVAADSAGGIETFLTALVGELGRLGCRSTLLASGDSRTDAELWPVVPTNLCAQMEAGTAWQYAYFEQYQLAEALRRAGEFDVIHSHLGGSTYAFSSVAGLRQRVVHTHHNPVTPDLEWYSRNDPELWTTTVSEFQARKLRGNGARRCHVIPNGIDVSAFTFDPQGGEELLFLGRIEWEKGPDLAVQVSRALGRPLTLAGPIIDRSYFECTIEPYLGDQIRYVGTVGHCQKDALLRQSCCVLVPSRWDEPFGLVAVEAMACGTPVVALTNGALPEIIEPGVTGYLARREHELPSLAALATRLDRASIRARVAARFDMSVVAARYLQLYKKGYEGKPQG
jgi:glycosyltransferase involved in cell wall biosynthesis